MRGVRGKKKMDAAERKLIDAAKRYCAIADWFENRPICTSYKKVAEQSEREQRARDAFDQAESDLRHACRLAFKSFAERRAKLAEAGVQTR